MKKLLMFCVLLALCSSAFGTLLTYDGDYHRRHLSDFGSGSTFTDTFYLFNTEVEDILDGTTGFVGGIYIVPQSAEPTNQEGQLYYDSDVDQFLGYANGSFVNLGAGAGSPAGADTQVQYNNGGSFGAIASLIWDDIDIVVLDDVNMVFGTNKDWHLGYDESVDNQLLFRTEGTGAVATTDPMFEVLVGTTPTADQQVFGVAKGTQASNTALFTVDEDGDGEFAGSLTLGSTLYQADVISAAAGNVALTVNAAGNGTIAIGDVSTGAVTITPATTVVGALSADGAVTLGNASADNITVTGTVVSNITMDDGATDSPTLSLIDQTNETFSIVKSDGDDVIVTVPATEDFEIFAGNLAVGNGAPGTAAMDGEDFYVQGDSEFDGAVQFDGLPTSAAGLTVTAAAVNLNVSSNFAANIATGTSTGTVTIGGAAAQTIAIGDGAAAKTVSLGSSNTSSTTTILGGSNGVNINVNALNDPTNINTGVNTGTVTIGGTGAQTISIGNAGTGAKVITLGDGAAAGSTDILSGTGNLTINEDAGAATTNVGAGTTTGTVTIGGAGIQSINVGIGAAAKTVALGSTNSTSTTTINSGSGGIVIAGDIAGSGPTTTSVGLGAVLEVVLVSNVAGIAESGTVFTNTGDGDGSLHTLPEASTALGCSYTFVVVEAQILNINPADGTDRIWGLTNGAGDSIQSAGQGDCITLLAAADDVWVVKSSNNSNGNADAWADAD